MKPSPLRLSAGAALAGSLGLIAAPADTLASGFAVPELSVAGLGTSNALVANPRELGAIPYNPAAMGFHEHSGVSAGMMLFGPNLKVSTSTGNHDSEGDDTVFIPNLQGVLKLSDRWSLGLGVNAPFGLETEWRVGTFAQLSAPIPVGPGRALPPGLFHPTKSKLELLSLVPTAAFKANENLSIGAGVDYYDARKVQFNTGLVELRGDGDTWGWNLSALYRAGALSLGASYHSEATVNLDGDYTVVDPALAALGLVSHPAKADLDLPSRLQLGMRYAFNDRLAAEFDWTRAGWSSFKAIEITSADSGAELSKSTNNWDDANAYRVGLTYDFSQHTQLRLGYTYDETGQNSEYFSARIPDADRQLFSIGLAHGLGDGWQLEGGYMYVMFDDNDYRGDRPIAPVDPDPNGTGALNGDYKAHVRIFGIGVNKSFL